MIRRILISAVALVSLFVAAMLAADKAVQRAGERGRVVMMVRP